MYACSASGEFVVITPRFSVRRIDSADSPRSARKRDAALESCPITSVLEAASVELLAVSSPVEQLTTFNESLKLASDPLIEDRRVPLAPVLSQIARATVWVTRPSGGSPDRVSTSRT